MKVTMYELLGRVKDDNIDYEYVKYYDRIKEKDDIMLACAENIIYKLEYGNIELNDEVEIPEEPKGIPEKICTNRIINTKDILEFEMIQNKINAEYTYAINWILDYLESKGE